MATHLKYGGSTAARTLQCPAWGRLSQEVPFTLSGKSNPAADEGSMLHNCMEHIYGKLGEDFEFDELYDLPVSEFKGQKLTPELVENKLSPAVDAMEELLTAYGITDWEVEPFVRIAEDMGGSIDFIGISDDRKTVLLVDYKFGFVNVDAVGNAQLQFYALAAASDPALSEWFGEELESIILTVIQPDGLHGENYQTWAVDLDTIDTYETDYFAAVEASEDPESPAISGKACTYCPAQAVCPVKTGKALEATRVNEITAAKLAEYLPLADEVEAWAKAVRLMAHEQLELGSPIAGYKLVAKRASRVWNDIGAVADKVRKAKKIKLSEGFNSVLKSPAQLEKVCKKLGVDFDTNYAPMLSSVSTGTTIAKEGDKRSAVLPVAGLQQLNDMNS